MPKNIAVVELHLTRAGTFEYYLKRSALLSFSITIPGSEQRSGSRLKLSAKLVCTSMNTFSPEKDGNKGATSTDTGAPDDVAQDTPVPPISSPPLDPPDGGLIAWLQVAGSFALYWNHL